MAKTKNKKRNYITDPAEKLDKGMPWTFHFNIDPDVGRKLIEERGKIPTGADFGKLINTRLRKSYGLKKAS